MFYKLVCYTTAEHDWQPVWGLRMQGDGPYVSDDQGRRASFASPAAAVDWVRAQQVQHPEESPLIELDGWVEKG